MLSLDIQGVIIYEFPSTHAKLDLIEVQILQQRCSNTISNAAAAASRYDKAKKVDGPGKLKKMSSA